MLEYFENNPSVFGALFLLVSAYVGVNFLVGGKRAESRFPAIGKQRVVFREKWASGRSTAALSTKLGGASRVLDVVVTETELWIKGIFPMFSFIASKFDLLHKVPLSSIKAVEVQGSIVRLRFTNEDGAESQIELELKDQSGFIGAVNG